MNAKKWFMLLLSVMLFSITSGCGLQPESPASTDTESAGYIWPTETPIPWVTIAPADIATATATPTMRPITSQLRGRIAFQSDREGSLEIYVMNADGSAVSRLTNNPAVDVFPAWSADGEKIAFVSDRNGYPDIYTVNPDGTDLQKITDSPSADVYPAWSPDGNHLVFVSSRDGNDEIYTISLINGEETRLTDESASDYFPAWSPDGEWIAFTTQRDINPDIYKMRMDGSELTKLTEDPADDANPAWSPDGSRIAFTSNRSGFYELFVMNTDGSNEQQITFFRALVDEPSWSPDGSAIAFISNKDGSNELYIMSIEGDALNRLSENTSEDFYPAWSPFLSFLEQPIIEPTAAPEGVCINASDPDYGYSEDNPIRLGYDPRGTHETELSQGIAVECVPWLLGPQGQPLQTSVMEELLVNDTRICKVAVTYEGRDEPEILYFDAFNYEQPKAPVGFTCGSPVEYLKAITAANY